MTEQEIYEIPLYIEPERTVAEVKVMLDKLFGSEPIISLGDDFEFADGGMTFTIQYYAKDHRKLMGIIEDSGIKIDNDALWDMMD